YVLHRRGCLVDHLFGPETTLEGVRTEQYAQYGDGGGLARSFYQYQVRDFRQGKVLQLTWEGEVAGREISLTKEIRVRKGTPDLEIQYRIHQRAGDPWEGWLGVEFNLSMLDGNTDACLYHSEDAAIDEAHQRSIGELTEVSHFGIRNRLIATDIRLEFSRRCRVWRFPVETVSQSESGLEREYQSSAVIPSWRFSLSPGEEWDVQMSLKLQDLPLDPD
ncbi:MAG: DUF1926 domain-containing protein, partial [Nitrospirae bacterium]|nr:DUF1926 domain-containing protein [Nitrospirota bacterium]